LWGLFPEPSQLYVYDSSQSLSFLLYIYVIYKLVSLFEAEIPIIYAICSLWLWFSVGDVITIVYSVKTIEALKLEYCCMSFNLFALLYKYRGGLNVYFKN
jgi:hypothetical protein